MTNKIENLKLAKELHNTMFSLYQKRFSNCNRGFTGDPSKDVQIQESNIEEAKEWYNRYSSINSRLIKAATKSGDEFESAVNDANVYIEALKA